MDEVVIPLANKSNLSLIGAEKASITLLPGVPTAARQLALVGLMSLILSGTGLAQVTSPSSAAEGVDDKAAQSETTRGVLSIMGEKGLMATVDGDQIRLEPGYTWQEVFFRVLDYMEKTTQSNYEQCEADKKELLDGWKTTLRKWKENLERREILPQKEKPREEEVYFTFDGGIPDDGSTFMLSQQTTSGTLKGIKWYPHRFWDTPNILLHSINTASKIADFHSTERMLRRGGHELNPLLRNRPARIGIVLGFGTGGHVLIAWIFHRTGHHKLERWFMVPSIGASAGAAGWNYRRF